MWLSFGCGLHFKCKTVIKGLKFQYEMKFHPVAKKRGVKQQLFFLLPGKEGITVSKDKIIMTLKKNIH